jgi:hypothetical protein
MPHNACMSASRSSSYFWVTVPTLCSSRVRSVVVSVLAMNTMPGMMWLHLVPPLW